MRVEDRYVSPWQAFWVSFPHTMFAHMGERASGVAQASSRSSKIEKKDRTPIRYCMRPILVRGCLTFCDLISCVRLTSYIIARPIIPSGGTQKKAAARSQEDDVSNCLKDFFLSSPTSWKLGFQLVALPPLPVNNNPPFSIFTAAPLVEVRGREG